MIKAPIPPAPPSQKGGVTRVQPLRGFRFVDTLPPSEPRGSVVPRNVRSKARQQFGSTAQLRRHGRFAEFRAEAA